MASRPAESRRHTTSPGLSRALLRPAMMRPPVHTSWLKKCLEGAKRFEHGDASEPIRRDADRVDTRPLSRTMNPLHKASHTALPSKLSPILCLQQTSQGDNERMENCVKRPATQNARMPQSSTEVKSSLDDYSLGKELGQGAYASVRAATHIPTSKFVAIKTYEKFKLLDPQRKKSVQREIRILSKLDHPHIVKLVETIDCTRQLHLVLEFVPGISLAHYLKQKSDRRLEECEAKRIFRQLLSGLEYCHARNVSHRDLKLENVLLDDRNNVKIIDFGFATCFARDKKAKMFCGTPSYMAPEIVSRREYCGPPADVWALGVILYAMLCGTLPFKAQNDKELYQRIQRGQYSLPLCVPVLAKPLLASMLAVEAAKRPTVPQIMAEAWVGMTADRSGVAPLRPSSFLATAETGVLRAVLPRSLGTSGSQRRLRVRDFSPGAREESPSKLRTMGRISE